MKNRKNSSPAQSIFFTVFTVGMGFALLFVLGILAKDFDPKNFGLGMNTTSRIAVLNNDIFSTTGENETEFINTLKKYDQKNKINLILGASQLHAINRYQPDDLLTVERLNRYAVTSKSHTLHFQASFPNANFYDMLIAYLLLKQNHISIKSLTIALTYDDLREPGLHSKLISRLTQKTFERLKNHPEVYKNLLQEYDRIKKTESEEAIPEDQKTPQEVLELKILSVLDSVIPGYKHRYQILGKFEVGFLNIYYNFISLFLGPKQTESIPKIIAQKNQLALKTLLHLAQEDNCQILIYRQPIKPTRSKFYYDRHDYDTYWAQLQKTNSSNINYLDLENIVPENYWGKTNSGRPDYFHFQAKGHELLARQLFYFYQRKKNVF